MLLKFYFKYIFIIVYVCLLYPHMSSCSSKGTLKYLQMVWRHGDRTPIRFIPTDDTNDVTSWGDEGQLTRLGMWQHFQFGQWTRKKYVEEEGFLSGNYSSEEFRVESTDYNRTIMSAMSNFAGFLYNSSQDYIPSTSISWVPVPVHMFDDPNDKVFDSVCSDRCDAFQKQVLESEEWKKMEYQNANLFKFLADKMGVKEMTLLDGIAYDALTCDMWHCNAPHCMDIDLPHNNPSWNTNTHPWPDWVNKSIYDQVVYLHDYRDKYYYYNAKFIKYCIGYLLNDIVENMLRKAQLLGRVDYFPKRKYFAYSAHDDTVQSILTQLGVFNEIAPPFACAVIFELRELNNKYYVQLKYRNTTTNYLEPEPEYYNLPIPDCSDQNLCTLEEFYKYTQTRMLTPNNYEKECIEPLPDAINPDLNKGIFIAMTIMVGVFGATFLLSAVLYLCTREIKNKIDTGNQMKSIN